MAAVVLVVVAVVEVVLAAFASPWVAAGVGVLIGAAGVVCGLCTMADRGDAHLPYRGDG